MKKIRVVILGCGRMGRRHANAYKNNPHVTIKGFYDVKKSLASSVSSEFKADIYSNIDSIMSDPAVDAVSICTPNTQHYEILESAIESGKNVLVEKPIVTTAEHCNSLLRIMKRSKNIVMVGHTQRFYPCNLALKSVLETGKIGKPKIINTFDYIPGKNPSEKIPDWIKDESLSGGGVLMTDFIHTVDKISWLMESNIKQVHTHLLSNFISRKKVEDAIVATIELKNGLIATCVHGCPSPGTIDMSVRVIGTEGEANLEFAEDLTILTNTKKHLKYLYMGNPTEHTRYAFFSEIDEFISANLEDRQPSITYKDGVRAVRVILSLYESFKKKKPIIIDDKY